MSIKRPAPSWSRHPAARLAFIAALVLAIAAALSVASCGDNGGEVKWPSPTPSPGTPTPAASPSPSPTPEPPKELRVAFINLSSPLTLDADNALAGETFEERLKLTVQELKAFDPDVVGFNEASVTKAYGSAIAYLAKELKLEPVYARANPWFPGQSKEQSDELAKQVGFEEGELLLVQTGRWPLVGDADSIVLNPRTSESGERRVAVHLVLKAPEPAGTIDVYITHLTGGGDRIRAQQVQFFANWIAATRTEGPAIVMGDFSEAPGATVFDPFVRMAFVDVAQALPGGTCCRESVAGVQPDLTARTDYIFAHGWTPVSVVMFADKPGERADGTPLYASDHNGLAAVFVLDQLVFPGTP